MRRAADIGGQELSYAEVKAIASGNPAVLTLAEADAELQRLTVLKKNHADEQYLARRNLRSLPEAIASLKEKLANLTADAETAKSHAEDPITVGGNAAYYKEAAELLGGVLESLPKHVREPHRHGLGIYQGLRFGLVRHPQFPPDVYLEGAATLKSMLNREHHGPRAILNAAERLANSYGTECARVRQELSIAESQLRDYQARMGVPFMHESYLSQLTALRDQLKAGLSATNVEPTAEPRLAVSEVAGQIKALRAANTIEGVPERTGRRRGSAEEPVTARIRRRLEATLANGTAVEPDVAAP